MIIDKYVVMTILQSKGVVSFDEWNYELMDVELIVNSPNLAKLFKRPYKSIRVNFSGDVSDLIDINIYNQILRDKKIDDILK